MARSIGYWEPIMIDGNDTGDSLILEKLARHWPDGDKFRRRPVEDLPRSYLAPRVGFD